MNNVVPTQMFDSRLLRIAPETSRFPDTHGLGHYFQLSGSGLRPHGKPLPSSPPKRVIVTPAVYPRLDEPLHFDIQSTGQKSHCVNINL